jgi:hypothetical protein
MINIRRKRDFEESCNANCMSTKKPPTSKTLCKWLSQMSGRSDWNRQPLAPHASTILKYQTGDVH